MGKLIAIEDVEKLWRYKHNPDVMTVDPEGQYITLNNIYHLTQIDIEETIKEMIDSGKGWNSDNSWNYLEELLQKFKS